MKIYLDVSCLNRPFDDQEQVRIRRESEAIGVIFDHVDSGAWDQVSSEMALIEIDAMPDKKRRARVRRLLPDQRTTLPLGAAIWGRAEELQELGFKPADAVHVAAAEEARADVFLSCDDRLCRTAKRHQHDLRVLVKNPLDWLKELGHATNE